MKLTFLGSSNAINKPPFLFSLFSLFPFFSLFVGLGVVTDAEAFRNTQFPPELKNQTTITTRQSKFFAEEALGLRNRPVWVHGGDSLSVAWGSRSSLRNRFNTEAKRGELPDPVTVNDVLFHLPSVDDAWHTGRNSDYGFLSWLQNHLRFEWVVLSTALAGARFNGDILDQMELMAETKSRDRVKLVTFSLGSNDICKGFNPVVSAESYQRKVSKLKQAFPENTPIVAWSIPQLKKSRQEILNSVLSLPDGLAKERLYNYCVKAWDHHCPALKTFDNDRLEAWRVEYLSLLEKSFGPLFDPFALADQSGLEMLDLMSSDCFHPSKAAQAGISDALAKHIQDNYQISR